MIYPCPALYKTLMPTFVLSILFWVSIGVNFIAAGSGYASLYTTKSLFSLEKSTSFSQSIGFKTIDKHSTFRHGLVGVNYDSTSMSEFSLEYGLLRPLKKQTKISYSMLMVNQSDFSSRFYTHFYGCIGFLQRISPQFLMQYSAGVPLISIGKKASFIISVELNYFHGSGIEYRENTNHLKQVKKRFLWFFWIDD